MLDIEGLDEYDGWQVPSKPLKSFMRNSASLRRPFSFVPILSTETVSREGGLKEKRYNLK